MLQHDQADGSSSMQQLRAIFFSVSLSCANSHCERSALCDNTCLLLADELEPYAIRHTRVDGGHDEGPGSGLTAPDSVVLREQAHVPQAGYVYG